MKNLFLLFFILGFNLGFAQITPTAIDRYEDDSDMFIYNSLTLSSDSICFIYSNCECGDEHFTKGKWEIKSGNLIIYSLPDSLYSIYPKVNYVFSDSEADSVEIYFTNYFNKPIEGSLLAFKQDDSTFKPQLIYLDKQGYIKLSKQIYSGFMVEYEQYTHDFGKGDIVGHYFEDKKLAKINIQADFDKATYDRHLKQIDLGTLQYVIRKDGLYDKDGKVIYKKVPKGKKR